MVFADSGMSPRSIRQAPSPAAAQAISRLWVEAGRRIREVRSQKGWTVERLSRQVGVSRTLVYDAEAGVATSLEALARLSHALGMRLELELVDPRRRDRPTRTADLVHSAMGEVEAAHLREIGHPVGIDEPYQHYQFAGRADLVAWDLTTRAMLHIENRTRFPDLQEMAGAYNAKRAYLGASLADRLGIPGWRSETHVIAAAWTAEVLHALRLRRATFGALCPDSSEALVAWWSATPPPHTRTSSLIVLDPLASGRQRRFIGLEDALRAHPRHRGYADLAARLGEQP
jgi:transcriptional regulator with XRE-family HTH domain